MRYVTVAIAAILTSASALAVSPERWTVNSTEELLKGETDGFSIGADGTLRLGPELDKIADVPDAYVLSQTSDSRGTLFVGTGGSGNVYRVDREGVQLLFSADEPQIYSLELAGGHLWVGSSPTGRLYRVDPESGAHQIWYEPKEAYIWDIEVAGDVIYLATGVEGRLIRVAGKGRGEVLYDSSETHLRTVAQRDDVLLVGGSGQGRIYQVDAAGNVRAIFDSSYSEISALTEGSGLAFWAAGVTSTLPTTPPRNNREGSDQRSSGQSGGSPSVEVTFSFDSGATSASGGSSELYKVMSDGYVETVWRLDREIIYDIAPTRDGGVVVATGPKGRIYEVGADGRVTLLASAAEKQIVSIDRWREGYAATTTNGGAIYSVLRSGTHPVSFTSAVRDTGALSRFGEYELSGASIPEDINVAFRSGNSNNPDETWSEWRVSRGSTGNVQAAPARYLQWRISDPSPPAGLRIDSMTVSWLNRNLPPSIESFTVADPAVVYLSGGYPTAPGVVEAANPDQYGIFTSISEPSAPEGGKQYFRKGFRTIGWKTSDPNKDELRHDLWFRPRGGSQWYRLREGVRGQSLNFDTTQLPDGEYELRLDVSDEPSNETGALEVSREDLWFVVDNTPPVISTRREGNALVVSVRDASSAIGKTELSIDVEEWKRLEPVDGISDSREETYRLDVSEVEGKLVIVRSIDGFYNVATIAAGD